jgi:hypothetical protein
MHGVKTVCAATMQIKSYPCAIPNILYPNTLPRKQVTVILRPLMLNRSVTRHARIFKLHNLGRPKGIFHLMSCVKDQIQSGLVHGFIELITPLTNSCAWLLTTAQVQSSSVTVFSSQTAGKTLSYGHYLPAPCLLQSKHVDLLLHSNGTLLMTPLCVYYATT